MGGDPSSVHAALPPLHIHRPMPRRALERSDSADSPTHDFSQSTPPSAIENRRTNDFVAQLNARLLRTCQNSRHDDSDEQERGLPRRNQSLLNLTSSTLSGIYDESGEQSTIETPWGTGAETPKHILAGSHARATGIGSPDGGVSLYNRARSGLAMYPPDARKMGHVIKQPRQGTRKYLVIAGKLAALYVFGVMYGVIVSHVHETKQLTAIYVDGVDQKGHAYLATWGVFGVALGSLFPYVDLLWDAQSSQESEMQPGGEEAEEHDPPISEQLNDIVRSVGAFIGIAFAIRRLPWQSTIQLTLTLALVNPVLWYILDRSKSGLSVSLTVTSILTSLIFLSNPDVLPSPFLPTSVNATHLLSTTRNPQVKGELSTGLPMVQMLFFGMISYEELAVLTWVGSVLFCSCVCFGSIGRRLAILDESPRKR